MLKKINDIDIVKDGFAINGSMVANKFFEEVDEEEYLSLGQQAS